MTQTEIDQRETARVEAILQACRWACDPQDALNLDLAPEPFVNLICAVQHDLIEDSDRRHAVVSGGLDLLAEVWTHLPNGERDVVLAGILAGDYALAPDGTDIWRELLGAQSALRIFTRRDEPEERVRVEREYARLLRTLTGAVVSA